jgi:hypothetical protein
MEQGPVLGWPDMWLTCDSVQAFVVEEDGHPRSANEVATTRH